MVTQPDTEKNITDYVQLHLVIRLRWISFIVSLRCEFSLRISLTCEERIRGPDKDFLSSSNTFKIIVI